ncbi:MAG: hypothetical protein ABID84_05700 [Chloroflexota bacterium]
MSRFHTFSAQNAVIQLVPVGFRKHWGLRNLPYRTGDELIVRLKTLSTHYEKGLITDFRPWYLVMVSPTNIDVGRGGYFTTHKDLGVPVTFGRIAFSGEYRIDVVYYTYISKGQTGAELGDIQVIGRDEGVAVVQVKPDYLLWAIAWGLALMVAGGVLGKLLEKWLF